MTATLQHSWYLTVRQLRALWRQPWWIAISLVQPVIWLLLFGALFKKVVEIPGFGVDSYATYLAPGIVVMTALFSGGWSGMSMLNDIERGVLDRFLATPVRRLPLIAGLLTQVALTIAIQSVIIMLLALAVGASFPGGVLGVIVLIACSILVAVSLGALSNGLALIVRREETLIAMVQFIVLPLTFVSGAFMQISLAPGWIQSISKFNPVNWAVEAGREALAANIDWGLVLSRLGYLAALAIAAAWLATAAFRSYQRSL